MEIAGKPTRKSIVWLTVFEIVVFGLIAALMVLIDCRWYAFLILGILMVCLFIFYITLTKKKWQRILCIFVTFILAITTLVLGRPDLNVSFAGTLARESIRVAMQLPQLKGDGLFKQGADFAAKPSTWQAPSGYSNTRMPLANSALEILRNEQSPSQKVIYQLHGGGYVIGFMDMYRDHAVRYSNLANGAAVASLDYRLAPAVTYPAALEDALDGWAYLLANGYQAKDIIVVGDSAGGNLALALTETLRDRGCELPAALVLMSPWTDMAAVGESQTTNIYKDPMFGIPEGTIPDPTKKPPLYAGKTNLQDPYLSPAYADFHGFPPMLIQVGTWEVLESDSQTVYQKATDAGVSATLTEYEGMFHVFQLFGDLIPESHAAWIEVEGFVAQFEKP